MYNHEIRDCPICSGNKGSVKCREGDFELCECSCGMLYTRNPLTIESKRLYYKNMARRCRDSRGKIGAAHYTLANQIKSVPLYSQSILEIRDLFPHGEVNIVDLGCAGGLFLLGMQVVEDAFNIDYPPRYNVGGIAFDPGEKDDTVRYTGCQTFMLNEAEEELKNWADVLTMFNILEHVNNINQCLTVVKGILRKNGILIIDVPNNQVLKCRAKITGRWPALDLSEHINLFTPFTLDWLLERKGFKKIKRLPGLLQGTSGFGTRLSWKQLLRWLVSRVVFLISRQHLQIFPHMTVIYKKTDKLEA